MLLRTYLCFASWEHVFIHRRRNFRGWIIRASLLSHISHFDFKLSISCGCRVGHRRLMLQKKMEAGAFGHQYHGKCLRTNSWLNHMIFLRTSILIAVDVRLVYSCVSNASTSDIPQEDYDHYEEFHLDHLSASSQPGECPICRSPWQPRNRSCQTRSEIRRTHLQRCMWWLPSLQILW